MEGLLSALNTDRQLEFIDFGAMLTVEFLIKFLIYSIICM